MPVDLSTLIFEEILKISPELLARYPTVQDKLLYLILIPHVVLFMFLLFFADLMVRGHPRIRNLIMVSAYIYVIFSGFYNTVANIASLWYTVLIPIGFFLFIFTFFVPWSKFQKSAHMIGRVVGEPLARRKELERLYDELKHINRSIYDELRALNVHVHYPDTYKGGLAREIRRAGEEYKRRYGEEALKEWENGMRALQQVRLGLIKRIEELEKRL